MPCMVPVSTIWLVREGEGRGGEGGGERREGRRKRVHELITGYF